ncbi:hypothetical protein ABZ725_31000 [Streptomyces sp. NPDC006872]|uniref:hypothetical protein n=1 Tax=Streptomyces sp. NPDC006872 TaxID=3155720 RepID=UPI0033F1DE2F
MGYEELVTEAVKARIAGESDRWLRAGLSTERCDRPAAEAAVAEVYRVHGMPAPETVVWMDSPLGGALASWVLRHGWEDRLDGTLLAGAGLPLTVPQAFARQAEERICEQLGRTGAGGERRLLAGPFQDTSDAQDRLVDALGHPMFDHLDFHWLQDVHGAYELEQEMHNIFNWSTNESLGHIHHRVYRDLLGRVRGPVPERIVQPERDGDVITPPPPPSREQIYFHEEFGDGLDSWSAPRELIRWRCMLAAAGLPESPGLEAVQEALYRCGGWWPLADAVVLTERPVVLRYERTPPEASTSGSALIVYADGYQPADA